MRLSNAMAMGRVLVEPTIGLLRTLDRNGGCALGMAGKAAGTECSFEEIVASWPWIIEATAVGGFCCPKCTIRASTYFTIIGHIFDSHVMLERRWTLDQLIDWVKSVEPPEETATEASPVQIEQAVSA